MEKIQLLFIDLRAGLRVKVFMPWLYFLVIGNNLVWPIQGLQIGNEI